MARLTKTLLSLRVSWTPRRSAWCARRLPRRARRRRRHLCQTPHRRPRRRTTRPPSWPRSKRAPPRRAWSRSVGVLAPRRALAGEAGPCPPGPGAREGYTGQPPARVLAQVLSRARARDLAPWVARRQFRRAGRFQRRSREAAEERGRRRGYARTPLLRHSEVVARVGPDGPSRRRGDCRRFVQRLQRNSGPRQGSPRASRRLRLARARPLAQQEVAAVKKGPEKRAFLTLCQWQLAWDRCPFTRPGARRPGARASTALGSRSRSSPRGSSRWPKPSRTAAIALRSRCRPRALSFSWHLVRRASRAGRGLEAPRAPWHRVRRRGAQGAPPSPPRALRRRRPLALGPARRSFGLSAFAPVTQISTWARRS